ncbi:Helitron helicase [Phytophthora megakarya]|uniref:ATP-dependent DNA helicase n=1 Tax=Phytophthora megakarya TaxID=4795 RepID=A0A225WCG6_9STRA|nr:Helitron helicase [Phytophthora megakarya]
MVTRLNPNQQDISDQVISGTGKSFLLEQLLAKVRLEGGVAIAVASRGIAAMLLNGGRTAHSMFRIPHKPNEHSTCGISEQTQKANLIRQARLIIWDEALMMHRSCFEAVDRTFRDIMDNDREPFGGKAIVFCGDHRQILPVLKDATRAETLKACFKASPLWRHLKQVRLFENMPQVEVEFPNFTLLRDNEGYDPCDDPEPEDDRRLRTVNALIDAVCSGVGDENLPDQYFVDRAILAPTNASVRRINEMVAERLSGETKEYLSNDSLECPGDQSLFEPEFLNSLNFSGMAPHKMILKVGTPVIMIRNLNSDDGLCNGRRLRVVALREKCMDATIMTGPRRRKRVFIPRVVFFSDDEDKEFPFTMRRKQFPVVQAFAMTINKAQGQSIHHVGIYLETLVFAHCQLYVALSRVTSRKAIKIAIDPKTVDEDGSVHTKNRIPRNF